METKHLHLFLVIGWIGLRSSIEIMSVFELRSLCWQALMSGKVHFSRYRCINPLKLICRVGRWVTYRVDQLLIVQSYQ